jgi:hypothetical protein
MMTLKKRMIVTNILMIAVPVALCFIAELFVRIIAIRVLEAYGLSFPDNGRGPPPGIENMPFMYLLFFGQVALIMGIFFASNMFFTRRLVKPGFNWQVQHHRIWQKPQMGFCKLNTSSVLN